MDIYVQTLRSSSQAGLLLDENHAARESIKRQSSPSA